MNRSIINTAIKYRKPSSSLVGDRQTTQHIEDKERFRTSRNDRIKVYNCRVNNRSMGILLLALIMTASGLHFVCTPSALAGEIPKTVERTGTEDCPQCEPLKGELSRIRDVLSSEKFLLRGDSVAAVGVRQYLNDAKMKYSSYEGRLKELIAMPAQPSAEEQKRIDDQIAAVEKEMARISKNISRLEEEKHKLERNIEELETREAQVLNILGECMSSCRENPPKPLKPHPVDNNCAPCSKIADSLSLALAETEAYDERIDELAKERQKLEGRLTDLKDKETELGGTKGLTDETAFRNFLKKHYEALEGAYRTWLGSVAEKINKLSGERMQASIRADDLRKQLIECQDQCREKPKKTACLDAPYKPVQIGPQSQYGSGFAKSAGDTAKKVAGGLLGGFVKGPVSLGGGGGGSEEPRLATNPIKEMKSFTDTDTGTTIKLGGRQTEQGLLIAGGIEKGDGKPTFHSITIHRDDCDILVPQEYYLYELWLNWSLHVSWSKTTYQDGKVVSSERGEWSKSGSELLDRGMFASNRGGEGAIWRQLGFDRATEGAQEVGAMFKADKQGNSILQPGDRLIVHVTQPDKDPVTTLPFVFDVTKNPDGSVNIEKSNNAARKPGK